MKRKKFSFQNYLMMLSFTIMLFSSCQKIFIEADVANTAQNNFNYLWNDVKNRYSYLDYKGVDWNKVYDTLAPKVHDGMLNEDLFNVLATMMNTLHDGHVNLTSPFNISNYYPIFLNSPPDYDGRLVLEHYLLRDSAQYHITGGLQNTIIDTLGVRVGYIRYASFSTPVSSYDISYVINRFLADSVDGVIMDVRSNGGGDVGNVFKLVNHFADQKRLAYFSQLVRAQRISLMTNMFTPNLHHRIASPVGSPCLPIEAPLALLHFFAWR